MMRDVVAFVLLLSLIVPASAQPRADKIARVHSKQAVSHRSNGGNCTPGEASAELDAGNVRAALYNTGGLFKRGGPSIYEAPKGSGVHAIFSSALWVGGLVEGELRMVGGTFSYWEFWPGPLDSRGNPPEDCSAYDRIYIVDAADVAAFEQGHPPTQDMIDWPVALGAPFFDVDGDGIYHLANGDYPKVEGAQTAWWVMNDGGVVGTEPIKLEVGVTAYTYDAAGGTPLDNTTFYRYRLHYRGTAPLEAAYVALWADTDLGHAADDYTGSDTTLSMGFTYNADDFDEGILGYGANPPALGYVLLQGPLVDGDHFDNDGDGEVDEAGERLGMSKYLDYEKCCVWQADLEEGATDDTTMYNYMRGVWKDGSSITFGGEGHGGTVPVDHMYPADPPGFWSEEHLDGAGSRNTPEDTRFVLSSGPFTMEPGAVQEFAFAIVWSRGETRLESVQRLKEDAARIHAHHQAVTTSAGDVPQMLPSQLSVHGNVPNPFDQSTELVFDLPEPAAVSVAVYDLQGRRVVAVPEQFMAPGTGRKIRVDAAGLAAGVYVYTITARAGTRTWRTTREMVRVK